MRSSGPPGRLPLTPLFKPLIWTSFNIIWKSHVWKSHSLLEHAWSKSSSTGQFNWPMAIETQRPISNGSHYSLGTHAKPYSVGSGHRTWFSVPSHCLLPVGGRTTPQTGYHLKSHVWKSHSLLDYLIQLVHGTEQVLPTMIWYMVVVLER